MERFKTNTVTIKQQKEAGLLRHQSNYVPAAPVRHSAPPMPLNSQVAHVIDVAPVATTHIDVRTSETDRAKGFLLRSLPLYGAFGLLVVFVCTFFYNMPFLSLPALVIFWLSFVAAWLLAYCYDLSRSPAGIAHMEATNKWDIIRRHHDRMWNYYERQLEKGGE